MEELPNEPRTTPWTVDGVLTGAAGSPDLYGGSPINRAGCSVTDWCGNGGLDYAAGLDCPGRLPDDRRVCAVRAVAGPALTTPWLWPAPPASDAGATICAGLVFAARMAVIAVRDAREAARE